MGSESYPEQPAGAIGASGVAPKNILIFADGTGQMGGMRPDQQMSNIYKLFRATRVWPDNDVDPREQVAFYDPGLGTNATGAVRVSIWERMKTLAGLAVGLGFSGNVIDCYEAILRRYNPGDRIYLFGFSRGGYTVRAVANVLNLCGVPTTDGKGKPLPRAGHALRKIAKEAVMRVYEHGAGHPRKTFEAQREALAQRFRTKYGAGDDPDRGDVFPEFIGVFDAVAALGLPWPMRLLLITVAGVALAVVAAAFGAAASAWFDWSPWWTGVTVALIGALTIVGLYLRATLSWVPSDLALGASRWHLAMWTSKHYDKYLDPRIPVVRHALAIDEMREHFGRVEWGGSVNEDRKDESRGRFRQRWFAGNHSDVGGSYPEDESRLSDIALSWMVGEATQDPHPIRIDRTKLHLHPDPLGVQHCEIFAQSQKPWWQRVVKWPSATRYIYVEADVDPSVEQRLRATRVVQSDRPAPYRPEALRGHDRLSKYYELQGGPGTTDVGEHAET